MADHDISTEDLDRFDDPLFAEPRVGLTLPGVIFAARRPEPMPRDGFTMRFEGDPFAVFADREKAARCAAELTEVFASHGIETSWEIPEPVE